MQIINFLLTMIYKGNKLGRDSSRFADCQKEVKLHEEQAIFMEDSLSGL